MKKVLALAILLSMVLAACVALPVSDMPTDASVSDSTDSSSGEAAAPSEEATSRTGRLTGAAPAARVEVDVTGEPAAMIADTDGYYRLQTMFLEAEDKCLEGNRLADESVLQGAAFQDDCQDVTGQLWKLVPTENDGYYRLQTMFLEEEDKCFEGNRFAPESVLGGGAFMDDCQDVSGQFWKFVDAGDGYYRLQTMFLEGENKCLEGNRRAEDAFLGGMAFMDTCQNVTGQLWKLVPADQDSSGPAQAGPSVMLTFSQIDDQLTVYLNDTPVLESDILRYNEPKIEIDLSDRLIPGRNILQVVAENGPGSASLVGSITVDGEDIATWDVITQSYGPGMFVDETYGIDR